jgi:hypothetical protein
MEPFRNRARTFGVATGIQENVYEIRFNSGDEFEHLWPTIVQLKSKGAPLRLRGMAGPGSKTGGLFATDQPIVRIYAPAYDAVAQRPGGRELRSGPPWPESIKLPDGLLPDYVTISEDGTTWIPTNRGGPNDRATGFKYRARVEIELVVDANVIDLNRIRLPPDTPIIDDRQPQEPRTTPDTFTRQISQCLTEIQAIKPGDTRARLLRVFQTEGGLSSRWQRRYVWKACPYVKVDVTFRAADDQPKESGDDVVTSISKPFLEWPIMD